MAMAPVVSYAPRQLSGDCPRNAVRLGKNCLRAGFTPGMLRSCESASKPFADLLHRCIPGRSPSISLRGARRLGGAVDVRGRDQASKGSAAVSWSKVHPTDQTLARASRSDWRVRGGCWPDRRSGGRSQISRGGLLTGGSGNILKWLGGVSLVRLVLCTQPRLGAGSISLQHTNDRRCSVAKPHAPALIFV